MIVEYDNARVMVTDQKIESIKEILPILEQLTRVNAPLLLVAEDVTGACRVCCACARRVLCVRAVCVCVCAVCCVLCTLC